ncbi:MAG: bifunctional folylpolyglutamate synthase/dihydrofolate synthase [Flavicella sp.]
MTYQECLDWLFVQLPMYQRDGKAAYKKDLRNTLLLAQHLNNPEQGFKSVHVAGTNGKGSCSHILASVLQAAGYKVGLYTSPHLIDFRERIKINGQPISEINVIDFVRNHQTFFQDNQLSFFEMTVGLAFDYFRREQVDIAIVEVGLGGRLDSTNILQPEVSVITNIGLDHTQFLGDTHEKIAAEKGGVIKKNIPVVIGEYHEKTFPVFEQLAQEKGAPLYLASKNSDTELECDLRGSYQKHNLKTVLQTLEVLKERGYAVSEDQLDTGLQQVVASTGLLGRWQIISETPKVIADTAHNREGLTYTMTQLQAESYKSLHIVLGMVNDKDLQTVLPLFPKHAQYYFCKPNLGRGLATSILKDTAVGHDLNGEAFDTVTKAFEAAKYKAAKEDVIYVGGSTFIVAEVLEFLETF